MKQRLFLLLMMFFSFGFLSAQDGGARIYSGISYAKNRLAQITPEAMMHTGYHFGLDARLNGGGMFFNFGVRYTVIDLVAQSSSDFFGVQTKHTIFSGRGGLGYHLHRFPGGFGIRAKTLASMNMNMDYDKESIANDQPFDQLVDATMGGVFGLAFDYKSICLDIEYEHGFVNMYSKQKGSIADNYSVSLGIFF